MSAAYRYVPSDNQFIKQAEEFCRRNSTDLFHPTGSVVVSAGQIIGRGANQARLHHKRLAVWHRDGFCLRKFLKIKTGTHYWVCPGCSPANDHSEQRAVRDALQSSGGRMPADADLYLWGHWWCCDPCWQAMRASGIRHVYLLEGANQLFK